MKLAKIVVENYGLYAEHNMPCAVCRELPAVLDLGTGLMQPCWDCQSHGYTLRRLPQWLRRWRRR